MNSFAGASNNSLASTSNGATNNQGAGGRSFRSDLLVAADSVTNAMSTLVRELNSGTDNSSVSSIWTSYWAATFCQAHFLRTVKCSRKLSKAFYSGTEIVQIRKKKSVMLLQIEKFDFVWFWFCGLGLYNNKRIPCFK